MTHGTFYTYNQGCRCGKCRQRVNAKDRAWRARNAESQREYHAQRRRTHGRALRSAQLKCRYGITLEEWEAMYDAQNGACAICESKLRLDVDHCHETGAVRGLLCRRCNLLLGQCGDDRELLEKAAAYLAPRP